MLMRINSQSKQVHYVPINSIQYITETQSGYLVYVSGYYAIAVTNETGLKLINDLMTHYNGLTEV